MTYASFVRWSLQLLVLTALFGLLLGEQSVDTEDRLDASAVEADLGNVTDAPPCDGPAPCDEPELIVPDLDDT